MGSSYWRGCLVLTHIPTGIKVAVDDAYQRSDHKKLQIAMKILRSKLYMMKHPIKQNEVHYEFPDDVQYPDELNEYKESEI